MREKLFHDQPLSSIAPHIPGASLQSSNESVGVRQFLVEFATRVNHAGKESITRALDIAHVVALV